MRARRPDPRAVPPPGHPRLHPPDDPDTVVLEIMCPGMAPTRPPAGSGARGARVPARTPMGRMPRRMAPGRYVRQFDLLCQLERDAPTVEPSPEHAFDFLERRMMSEMLRQASGMPDQATVAIQARLATRQIGKPAPR